MRRALVHGKKKKFLKPDSRSAKIFKEIIDQCDAVMTFAERPTAVLRYGMDGIRQLRTARERAYQRQEIRRLQQQKLLVIRKIGETYRVALTAKGEKEMLRLKVLDAKPMPDGCVCMVVFDIPESRASLRKTLRDFLRFAGFMPLQKSVWISSFDTWEPLAKLFNINKTAKWISVFVARKIDIRK